MITKSWNLNKVPLFRSEAIEAAGGRRTHSGTRSEGRSRKFGFEEELEQAELAAKWGTMGAPAVGVTVLDAGTPMRSVETLRGRLPVTVGIGRFGVATISAYRRKSLVWIELLGNLALWHACFRAS